MYPCPEQSETLLMNVSLFTVGWGADQGIGGFGEVPGIKAQMLNLIRSVRTVMRGKPSNTLCQDETELFSCFLRFLSFSPQCL